MVEAKARGIASRQREVVFPLCPVLLWAPQRKRAMAIVERSPSAGPPQGPPQCPLGSECWSAGANSHHRQQDGAVLARSSTVRRQTLPEQHYSATGSGTGSGTPLPILAVAACAASLVHGEGPPVPGRMGQANCCCGSRWAPPTARGHAGTAGPRTRALSHARRSRLCREALLDAEPVLSAAVRLTRGRKRSERRLLLLPEELVIAKLQ